MIRPPPISPRTDPHIPATTLFRSDRGVPGADRASGAMADGSSNEPARGRALRRILRPPAAGEVPDHRPRQCPAHRLERRGAARSEEHTSDLQSLMSISFAVFGLKTNQIYIIYNIKSTQKTPQ